MIYKFNKQYKFPISESDILKCTEFAKASTNDYNKRNQNDQANIQRQLIFGKIGELIAGRFIHQCLKYPKLDPDFRIFQKGDKSWDADFPYKSLGLADRNIHVKSYAPSDKPESWAFQYQNKNYGGTDELFSKFNDHRKDIIICVKVDIENNCGFIRVVGSWVDLRSYLTDPIANKLKGLKKFLYYEDLEEILLTK